MSLNSVQRLTTSAELRAHLDATGIPDAEVAAALGWTVRRLETAVEVGADCDPVDVWELRDFLSATLRRQGHPGAVSFTVLTDEARTSAQRWFALREPPLVKDERSLRTKPRGARQPTR